MNRDKSTSSSIIQLTLPQDWQIVRVTLLEKNYFSKAVGCLDFPLMSSLILFMSQKQNQWLSWCLPLSKMADSLSINSINLLVETESIFLRFCMLPMSSLRWSKSPVLILCGEGDTQQTQLYLRKQGDGTELAGWNWRSTESMVSKEQAQYIFEPHQQIFSGGCFPIRPLRVIVPHPVSYYTRMPIRLTLLSYLLLATNALLHATQTHLIPSGSYLQISLGIFLGGDQKDTNHQYDLTTFSQSLIFTFESVPYNILIFPSIAPKAFDQLACYKRAVTEGVPDIMCKFEQPPYPNCKECLEEAMSHGERVSACLNCAQPHLGIASNNTAGTTVLIIDNSNLLTGGDGRDLIVEAQAALGIEVTKQEITIFSIFAGVAGFLLLVALGVAWRLNQLIKKCQSLKAS